MCLRRTTVSLTLLCPPDLCRCSRSRRPPVRPALSPRSCCLARKTTRTPPSAGPAASLLPSAPWACLVTQEFRGGNGETLNSDKSNSPAQSFALRRLCSHRPPAVRPARPSPPWLRPPVEAPRCLHPPLLLCNTQTSSTQLSSDGGEGVAPERCSPAFCSVFAATSVGV